MGLDEYRGDFLEALSHLAGQGRSLHLQRCVIVAVDNFTKADFASKRFGEHVRIECQQQPVVLGELYWPR